MGKNIKNRQDRSPGLSYAEILDTDTHHVSEIWRTESPADFGTADQPSDVYTSRHFHDLEMEKIWLKVWQFACREEHIPEIGDTEVYDIGKFSVLIVRTGVDEIKAYPNACLHRGRLLRDCAGHATELRCPYHGYTWSLEGELKVVPSEWDFPQVNKDEYALTELPVGRWGGFIFISLDLDVEPFEEFLGTLSLHFENYRMDERFVEAHVAKVMRCNWKTAQEAFMEAFHLATTHPSIITGTGDCNSRYDVFGNFARAVTPTGTPSPHLTWDPSEQEMLDAMLDRGQDEERLGVVPEGKTAREMAAMESRMSVAQVADPEWVESLSDAEMIDSIYYTLFPNFHPWGGFNRIVYRFRPFGDEHEMSIFETLYLSPFKGDRPPPAKVHWIGADESILEAHELGFLARVFDQDTFNMPQVQKGMHTLQLVKPGITLSRYQETKLRHFFDIYNKYMSK